MLQLIIVCLVAAIIIAILLYRLIKIGGLKKSIAKLSADYLKECQLSTEKEIRQYQSAVQAAKMEVEKADRVFNELQSKIEDSIKAQAAINEALKRQQLERETANFYKVQLGKENEEDTKVLIGIINMLHNKAAVYKAIWSTYYQKNAKEMINRVVGANKVSGIYKITELDTGMCYIGQSVDIGNRWAEHIKSSLHVGNLAPQKIHDKIEEKGITDFSFEIIEHAPKSKLNEREKFWIKYFNSSECGYNRTIGG